MKSQAFILPEQSPVRMAKLELVISKLHELPDDKRVEIVFRDAHISKTMEQLGALFGVWMDAISDGQGYEVNYLHRWMKSACLARIYVTEPIGREQESWVELLAIYQQNQQQEKLERHAKRISLSWANLKQMKEYMKRVKQFWQEEGVELPELKKNGRNK